MYSQVALKPRSIRFVAVCAGADTTTLDGLLYDLRTTMHGLIGTVPNAAFVLLAWKSDVGVACRRSGRARAQAAVDGRTVPAGRRGRWRGGCGRGQEGDEAAAACRRVRAQIAASICVAGSPCLFLRCCCSGSSSSEEKKVGKAGARGGKQPSAAEPERIRWEGDKDPRIWQGCFCCLPDATKAASDLNEKRRVLEKKSPTHLFAATSDVRVQEVSCCLYQLGKFGVYRAALPRTAKVVCLPSAVPNASLLTNYDGRGWVPFAFDGKKFVGNESPVMANSQFVRVLMAIFGVYLLSFPLHFAFSCTHLVMRSSLRLPFQCRPAADAAEAVADDRARTVRPHRAGAAENR